MKRLIQLLLLITLLSGSVAILAAAGLPYIPLKLTALNLSSYLYGEPGQADFDAEPVAGLAPLAVTFTNTSTGDYTGSLWDFGDGQTSTLDDPPHIYLSAAVYTVTLTISGPWGTDTLKKTNYITVLEPAKAHFTAAPSSGTSPLEVSFTNSSTGDYAVCTWDYGDHVSRHSCNNVIHTYSSAGSFTVTLTVSNTFNVDSLTRAEYITVYTKPEADFSASPLSGRLPLKVNFTDLSAGDYDTCAWGFGDGKSSSICAPQHTYTASGTYTVTLTVSGLGGSDTEVKQELIDVGPGLTYLPAIVKSPGGG
jgi:PKD repeat protein